MKKSMVICAILVVFLSAWGTVPVQAADGNGEDSFQVSDVFVAGREKYNTYRIPAIIAAPDGSLLAFAEARKFSAADNGDIDLVVKRSTDGGKTWSRLKKIYSYGIKTVGNPAPVVDRDTGTIIVPFNIENRTVHITTSKDNGRTWSDPVDITADVKPEDWEWYAMGPGHAIQLDSGRLLIPCDHTVDKWLSGDFYSHVIYSDDHGETWRIGGSSVKTTNESIAVQLADGRVYLNMRNKLGKNRRVSATSDDGGETFSEIRYEEDLISPVCQGSVKRYSLESEGDKNRLLFSNPASLKRENMTVKLSYDEAQTWPVGRSVHAGPAAYSDLVVLPDKSIGVLYENGEKSPYEKISFAHFTLDWLEGGE